jgi:uncharacterized protein with FMN-binding domain
VTRISVWLASTVVGIVLLFSYHTSTSGPAGGRVVSGVAPVGVVAESPAPLVTAVPSPSVAGPARSRRPSPVTATHAAAAPKVVLSSSSPATRVAPKPSPSPAAKATTAPTRTINGAPADTRYGPVQVQIKVQGSRIVSSDAIVYPTSERRDQEINSQAVPQLNDETLQAQSANIDTVSGATYTSDGYRQSLQSALDAAHL